MRLGAVGPTGRASSLPRDARKDDPYAAYAELEFDVVTSDHNDVYGRTLVRVGELMQTYRMIRQLVKNMPDGPIVAKAPRKIPAGEAFSRYEAPRGEDVHYVRSNGTNMPERLKVRAPSFVNIPSFKASCIGGTISDVTITLAACDPCHSCTERSIRVRGAGVPGEVGFNELVRLGQEKTRSIAREMGRMPDLQLELG